MSIMDKLQDGYRIAEYSEIPKGELTTQMTVMVTDLFRSTNELLTKQNYPEVFGSRLQQYIDEQMEFLDGGVCFILFHDDTPVGYAHFINYNSEGSIGMLYVKEDYRGKGWARKLMDCCKKRAVREKCTILNLTVIANNTDAYRMYYKYGLRDSRITMRMKL